MKMVICMEKKYYLFEMRGLWLQGLSIVILIFMFILTGILSDLVLMDNKDLILVFVLIIPYLILHEFLHAFSYVLNGADYKNITFGVHLEKGIMCCLCKQNISKRNILISLLFPFIFIGVITYIIGLIIHNPVLVWLSIFNISGCSGDLMMFLALAKIKNFEYSEYDNPMAFGIYADEDLSKDKFLGLKYIGSVCKLDRNDMKKISVSKISIIFLLIFMGLGLVIFLSNM